MANKLGSNPWVFDTAAPGVIQFQSDIRGAHFEYSNYTSQASNCVIKDRNGKVVWSATGKADLSLINSHTIEWLDGLVVDTLTDGVVRLYFS